MESAGANRLTQGECLRASICTVCFEKPGMSGGLRARGLHKPAHPFRPHPPSVDFDAQPCEPHHLANMQFGLLKIPTWHAYVHAMLVTSSYNGF